LARDTFYYHIVNDQTAELMEALRAKIGTLSEYLEEVLPECRSTSLALTHLEDCCMRSVQALAVSEGTLVPFAR
jgi:hypothetical protein